MSLSSSVSQASPPSFAPSVFFWSWFATPGQLSHADPSVSPSGLAWSGFGTDLQLSTSSRMPSSSASLSGMVLQFGSAVPSLPSATAVLHFAWFGFEQQLWISATASPHDAVQSAFEPLKPIGIQCFVATSATLTWPPPASPCAHTWSPKRWWQPRHALSGRKTFTVAPNMSWKLEFQRPQAFQFDVSATWSMYCDQMNGSASWHAGQWMPRTEDGSSQKSEAALELLCGLGTDVPSRSASRGLWKKQVLPVTRLCWITAMSLKCGSFAPSSFASYLRQMTMVSTSGFVSMRRKRENGTHCESPARPSCTGLSQSSTAWFCATPPTVIGITVPVMQLNAGIAPISAAQVCAYARREAGNPAAAGSASSRSETAIAARKVRMLIPPAASGRRPTRTRPACADP